VTAAAALQGSGTSLNSLARRAFIVASVALPPAIALESGISDMATIESPLIGSGSQEEVDLRVQALLDLGTSRAI